MTLCLIAIMPDRKAKTVFFHNFSGMMIFFIMILYFLFIEVFLEKSIK